MYFDSPGKSNTQQTIDLALQAAREQGIEHIVVASNTGETALLLAGCELHVVCVTHAFGYPEKGKSEISPQQRGALKDAGFDIVTASHALSGVERGISNAAKGMYPAEIISNALRMLGQGTKVCVEIGIMALDAGLLPYGQKIVAIGGSGTGADTAVVSTPAHASEVFNNKIHQYICKPLL